MEEQMRKIAIVLAGGRGNRMQSDIPKQYLSLCEKPVLYYSLFQFEQSTVDEIILVAGETDIEYCRMELIEKYHFHKVKKIVPGGAQRYDSVYHALCAVDNTLEKEKTYVLIHDGARPCVTQDVIACAMENGIEYGAATVAVPIKSTIKVVDDNGFAKVTPDRSKLWQIQTPQAFRLDIIMNAYKNMYADANRGPITDDAMIVEQYTDIPVKVAMGSYRNVKLTTPEDMVVAELFLKK